MVEGLHVQAKEDENEKGKEEEKIKKNLKKSEYIVLVASGDGKKRGGRSI